MIHHQLRGVTLRDHPISREAAFFFSNMLKTDYQPAIPVEARTPVSARKVYSNIYRLRLRSVSLTSFRRILILICRRCDSSSIHFPMGRASAPLQVP